MKKPTDSEATTNSFDAAATEPARKTIGPYKLLQQIGEGGMGTVWMAEQEQPVRRRVALKLIKAGVADKQAIARFEAERQALAMMDHQNIARVLDAGTSDDGSPYFVMELVQGDPITNYCDINKLTPNKRLELFAQACDAVQHAHHKGIIHRDLKPSNILVQIHNGQPTVKVIDFGLAKALDHQTKLTDKTVFTEFGKVLGTVQYMSPEQARLDAIDIDTRTDVYSLGVILYELLAGSTPIEKETLQQNALFKVLEIIREQDPPRPSHRLSSSIDQQDSISAQRQIQPAKLQQILRGELDWIIMRALEKDRTRRYATPNDFAEDVRRYLTGDAVEARPPSAGYRLRKFVRKNRMAVGIVTGAFALVTGAALAIATYAVKANVARVEAEDSAKRSDKILQIVADSFQSVDPESGAEAEMSAKDVLLKAKESLDESDLDNAGKRRLLEELSHSFLGLGKYGLAIEVAQQWRRLSEAELGADHPDTLRSMNSLAVGYRAAGRAAEAIELFEETLKLHKAKLGNDHSDTLVSMNNLAIGYHAAGRSAEAIELLEQTLELNRAKLGDDHPDTLRSMNNLAVGYRDAGRVGEAIGLWEQTLEIQRAKLGDDHPSTLSSMSNLAVGYSDAGRTADAIELQEQTLEIRKVKLGADHPATLGSMNNLAIAYRNAGRTAEAIELYEQTLELQQAQLGADHPETLGSMTNLAGCYRATGRTAEAIELQEQTLELHKAQLGADHPDTLVSMTNLASCYRDAGRTAEAIELHEQTLELQKAQLGADHPDTLRSMHNLAHSYRAAGRSSETIELRERTLELRKAQLGADHPDTLSSMNNLVWDLATSEGMEARLDDQLMSEMRHACEVSQNGGWFNTLAAAEYRLGHLKKAVDAANASIKKMPPPSDPINLAVLAMSHFKLEQMEQANAFREELQEAMKSDAFKEDKDCQKFAKEVEALFEQNQ